MQTETNDSGPNGVIRPPAWRENLPIAIFAAVAGIAGFAVVANLPRQAAIVTGPERPAIAQNAPFGGRFPNGMNMGGTVPPVPGDPSAIPMYAPDSLPSDSYPGAPGSSVSGGMPPPGFPNTSPTPNGPTPSGPPPEWGPGGPPPGMPGGAPPPNISGGAPGSMSMTTPESVAPPGRPKKKPAAGTSGRPGQGGRPMPPIGKVPPLPPLPGGIQPIDPGAVPPMSGLPGGSMPGGSIAPLAPAGDLSRLVRNEAIVAGGRIVSSTRAPDGGRNIRISVSYGRAQTLSRRLREVVGGGGSVSDPSRADAAEDAIKDLLDDARKLRRERDEELKTFFEDSQPVKEIDAKLKIVEDEIKKRRVALRDQPVTIDVIVRGA